MALEFFFFRSVPIPCCFIFQIAEQPLLLEHLLVEDSTKLFALSYFLIKILSWVLGYGTEGGNKPPAKSDDQGGTNH